jgi:polysaccharide deacetylase family protein (PEP-CTERM system associated)
MIKNDTLTGEVPIVVVDSRRPAEPACKLAPSSFFRWNRMVDLAISAVLLIPTLLAIGVLVVLTRLTSRGPGIYRQLRTGKGGRTFMLYKVRTMRHDAEAHTGPVWTQTRDPRVTRLGGVLRRLHLDELPQLINVLKGEMSLVGPRPERPEFVRVLDEVVPGYMERLAVSPGITGLAQLNLPPDSDVASVYRKLALDCQYIEQAGFWLDLRIIMCTACHVLKVPERRLLRVFGVSRRVEPPRFLKDQSDNNRTSSEQATPISILIEAPSASGNETAGICAVAKDGNGRPPNGRPLEAEVVNALTFDVEDYFQVSAFESHIPRGHWDQWESRVVRNTRRILRMLDRHGAKATFFVLGWVGEKYPRLVSDIQARGHEIGSHGYWHELIYNQTPEQFRADLQRSRDVLQDIVGERITAYRAPSFSITKRSFWALDILVEEGFSVDSSVFPVYHDRYGIPGAQSKPHQITTASGPLWEFPPSVVRVAGVNVPVAGGGYFRLYPLAWTHYLLRRINGVERRPFVFYMHPWELDPNQPRIKTASAVSRFRHYVGLSKSEAKLDRLLQKFQFGRLRDVID